MTIKTKFSSGTHLSRTGRSLLTTPSSFDGISRRAVVRADILPVSGRSSV
jgi:hypothetical protein